MRHFVLSALLCLLFIPPVSASDELTVYAVNYPLQYFARQIAAGHARVEFPAPAGIDPAFWTPDMATIGNYQKADLVLLNGAGYAKWVQKTSLPQASQIDTSAAFKGGYIRIQDGMRADHGADGIHANSDVASTTWLDFHQAIQQAEAVMLALVQKSPEHKAEFEKNFAALRKDLMALDLEMQKTVAGHPGQPMLASQPVYHYMARRYEFKLEDLQWQADEVPDDTQWENLRAVTEGFPAGWILWNRQPLQETAARLKTMDIDVLVFDPCAARPAQGDFLSVMQRNVLNLGKAYR